MLGSDEEREREKKNKLWVVLKSVKKSQERDEIMRRRWNRTNSSNGSARRSQGSSSFFSEMCVNEIDRRLRLARGS